MIILKIMGGFGNQMFHYALARELLYRGKTVKADISYYDNTPTGDTARCSIKELLFRELPLAAGEEVQIFLKNNKKLRWKIMRHVAPRCTAPPVYLQEKSYEYRSELFNRENVYVIGWWQTEQYFMHVKDLVRKEYLGAMDKLDEKNMRVLEKIQKYSNCVSVHVRGGDYNNLANSGIFGGICGKEYYQKAFDFLNKRFRGCHFFVFTNDIGYAKNVLPELEMYEMIVNSEMDGCQDIFLMSQCKHHIIANSTFSWWGAWLDPTNDKVVIAPERWSHNNNGNPNCEGWVEL